MTAHPSITVIIPNYRGNGVLQTCLNSLSQQTYRDFDVIIVHNDPSEDIFAYLNPDEYEFPLNLFIAEEALGFARAANKGLAAVIAPYAFLLNNDAALDKDCLKQLIRAAQDSPMGGSFATLILNQDETEIESAGDELTVFGWAYQFLSRTPYQGLSISPRKCFSACAAAALYRMEALKMTGFFREQFHSYLEDVELGMRLRLSGWESYFIPSARCRHIGGWAHEKAMEAPALTGLRWRNELYMHSLVRRIMGSQRLVFLFLNYIYVGILRGRSVGQSQVPEKQRTQFVTVNLNGEARLKVRRQMWNSTYRVFNHVIIRRIQSTRSHQTSLKP